MSNHPQFNEADMSDTTGDLTYTGTALDSFFKHLEGDFFADTDGNVEGPVGFFGYVEIDEDAQRYGVQMMQEAGEVPGVDNVPSLGWYLFVQDNNGIVWVYTGDFNQVSRHYSIRQDIHGEWEAGDE